MEKENLIKRHHTKAQTLKSYTTNNSKYSKNIKIKEKIKKCKTKDRQREARKSRQKSCK